MNLTARRRLAIRPKSAIDRMPLVTLLALFGIERNRLELSRMEQEYRDYLLQDCRTVWRSRIQTEHPDKGGSTEQAQLLNAAFDRISKLLGPKPVFERKPLPPRKGRALSPERRRAISLRQMGHAVTPETRLKISLHAPWRRFRVAE